MMIYVPLIQYIIAERLYGGGGLDVVLIRDSISEESP